MLTQHDRKTNASGQIHACILAREFQLFLYTQPFLEEHHKRRLIPSAIRSENLELEGVVSY